MSLFSSLNGAMGTKALNNLPAVYQSNLPALNNLPAIRTIGNDITFYNADNSQTFIEKGYNLNDSIFSIVSKNIDKSGQVRFYLMRIKQNEAKTLNEYNALKKAEYYSPELKRELKRMVKSMVEDYVVDGDLPRLLDKPNRYQTQSEWIENLVAMRELTGEGNLWLNRGITGKQPVELLIIPRQFLHLTGSTNDPWEISGYQFVFNGNTKTWSKEDVVQWKYANPNFSATLDQFRGLAPLQSARVLMQAMNEGDERVAISNKNAGAAGLAFLKNLGKPTLDQANDIRYQFNNAVNNAEMANKIAILGGEWGYINFGYSLDQLKILEQYGLNFKRLCRVFKTPAEIFGEGNDTYDNQRQYKRLWIYDKIAPMLHQLRGILNDKLLDEFKLDRSRYMIDCDVNSLPEMAEDLGEQVKAIRDVYEMSPNQKLQYWGFEADPDPNMNKKYFPSGLTPLDELNMNVGGGLDQQMQDLNL